MKHILAIILIMLVTGAMSRIDAPLGWYSAIGNQTWAVNESVCIHEVGHMLDHISGDMSATGGWYHAVRKTLEGALDERSDMGDWMLTYTGGLYELYADIYQYCHGHAECVPDELKQFYDFGRGFTLIQERCMDYGKRKD